MPKSRAPYPAEFRQQIIELAQAGRHLELPVLSAQPGKLLALAARG